MDFLNTILSTLRAEAVSIWSKFSGAFNIIVGELPDDEITIMYGAMDLAADKIKAGATVEEAFTAVLNYVESSELRELSKVGEALMQAFIAALAAKATPAT